MMAFSLLALVTLAHLRTREDSSIAVRGSSDGNNTDVVQAKLRSFDERTNKTFSMYSTAKDDPEPLPPVTPEEMRPKNPTHFEDLAEPWEHWHPAIPWLVLLAILLCMVIAPLLIWPRSEVGEPSTHLSHLDGARAFMSMWIVFGHYLPHSPMTGVMIYETLRERGYIPVQFFIILSGFVTHYAYGRRIPVNFKAFYANRFGAIFPTYAITMLIGWYIQFNQLREHSHTKKITIAISQATFTQTLLNHDAAVAVNAPSWTLATLAFAWLLYPSLSEHLVSKASKVNIWILWGLCLPVSLTPMFILMSKGSELDGSSWWFFYSFAPCRVFDFIHGMVVAEMVVQKKEESLEAPSPEADARPSNGLEDPQSPRSPVSPAFRGMTGFEDGGARESEQTLPSLLGTELPPSSESAREEWQWYGLVADLCLFSIVCVGFLVHHESKLREGYREALLIFALQPFMGAFLYFSSRAIMLGLNPGLFGAFFSTAPMQFLGSCGFQVYLWQSSFFHLATCLKEQQWDVSTEQQDNLGFGYALATGVALWTFSYFWMQEVDTPFREAVRSYVKTNMK